MPTTENATQDNVLMTCCGNRYPDVSETLNHLCPNVTPMALRLAEIGAYREERIRQATCDHGLSANLCAGPGHYSDHI